MDDHPDLADALEPSQFTAVCETPLPRRKLGRGMLLLLVVLRVYVMIAIPLVAYAFVHALQLSQQ